MVKLNLEIITTGQRIGDDGADGTLDSYGANIAVSAGTYKIEVNFSSMTYTMEEYSWV